MSNDRLYALLFFLALAPTASAFDDSPAVPERWARSGATHSRTLPESFSAVGRAAWEDTRPIVAPGTPGLIAACRAGEIEKVRSLLAAGALANAPDELGERPLVAAVKEGHSEVVRQLLQRGAVPNVKGAEGRTPLGLAAAAGHREIVRLLLRAGALADARSDNRSTALHEAVRFDHADVVRELLAADPDVARFDGEGLHPLALAAARGRLASLKVLLDVGVDIDQPDRTGLTALFWARRYQQAPAEEMLVGHGASREAWPIREN